MGDELRVSSQASSLYGIRAAAKSRWRTKAVSLQPAAAALRESIRFRIPGERKI